MIEQEQDTTQQTYRAGDVIMRQGEEGDSAYIIESGRVEIILEQGNGVSKQIGTRGEGAIIGEMALIDHAPRTATIKALEDCKLQEITNQDFSTRLSKADPILRMTTQIILTRYRDMLKRAEITGSKPQWEAAEAMEQGIAENSDALGTVKIANDFKQSLSAGHIKLHYQPIIDLKQMKIAGYEALMRWNHPTLGFISPNDFIPVIEDNGFIVKASEWALEESLCALKRIEEYTNQQHLFMSVNFSSHDFAADNFLSNVTRLLEGVDIDPEQLHLEITERLLMGHPERSKEVFDQCREAGMAISIDDFGTGYSSLSYLHYFPINILKIDMSFVQGMLQDESLMEPVKTIVTLGKNMKMKIIAEGVETSEQLGVLKALDCDMAQGYFFSKPLEEKEISLLTKKGLDSP